MRRKRDKPLAVMHVNRLETNRGTAVPAWMTTEQRECVAVEKASSCRQMIVRETIGDGQGNSCHQRRNRDKGTREAKFLTKGESAGSQDERCHRHQGSMEKGSERTWIGSGSYARGALARRGERAGIPAPPPGRRIRPEETAPITLYYAYRPPSPGRGLNTHGYKARARRRGNTWYGVRGLRRRPSGRLSWQKIRLGREVGSERETSSRGIRSAGATGCETVPC